MNLARVYSKCKVHYVLQERYLLFINIILNKKTINISKSLLKFIIIDRDKKFLQSEEFREQYCIFCSSIICAVKY